MKKKYLLLPIRIILLLVAFKADIRAQCSATILTNDITVCSGVAVSIPITLTGIAPFTLAYIINGSTQQPVIVPQTNYTLTVPGFFQSGVVRLTHVEDATGCQATLTDVVSIQVSPPILLDANVTPVSCLNGGNDGAIEVTALGGAPNYTYAWSSGLPAEPVVEGLSAGAYTVTVTDMIGCTATTSATVTTPIVNIVSIQTTPISCNGSNNGSVNLTTAAGMTYLWSNGAVTEDISNLSVGYYSVTITQTSSGCTTERIAHVTESSTISITATGTPASCTLSYNGSIDVSVTGGTPNYTYLWSNGATTQDLSGVYSGTYVVTVTDASGCSRTNSTTLAQPSQVHATPIAGQSPTCGNSDGILNINIAGGNPPYQTLWSTGSTTEDLADIGTGAYTVTITDANGCTGTYTGSLGPFTLTIQGSIFQCLTNFDLTVTGGSEPYTYLWSNNATTQDLSGLSGGTYRVTVTDATGCTSITSRPASSLAQPVVHIFANNSYCDGYLNANIVSGGSPFGASFIWSNGSTSSIITNVPAGTYRVTATSSSGCTGTATITTPGPTRNAGISLQVGTQPILCYGATTGAISLDSFGVFPPISFLWSTGATSRNLENLPAGTYSYTISDAEGCAKSGTRTIQQPSPMVVSWVVTNTDCNTSAGKINLFVSGGTPLFNIYYTYAWSNGATTQDINNLPAGVYIVTVTDGNGCTYISPDILVDAPFFAVDIDLLSAQCNNEVLSANISGGFPPYQVSWTGPNNFHSNNQNITASSSGIYNVQVVDNNSCFTHGAYEVLLAGTNNCGYITGRVVQDQVENCLVDPSETALAGWLVRAESTVDTFYGITNQQGTYSVSVPPGIYTMVVLPPNALWEVCPSGVIATVNTPNDIVFGGDFPVKVSYTCPSLSVLVGIGTLRRCFSENYYHIYYCNQGTTPAANAYIQLKLDPFIIPLTSDVPYIDLGNGVLQFNVGDLEIGECRALYLRVAVSCDAALGQTHCMEAHIYPDGTCVPEDLNWSGASLRVSGQCAQDSVRFTIKNIGQGDMQNMSEYIVVEDAVMLMQVPFQLTEGDSTNVAVPANGSTWRIELEQEPFHPGDSSPSLSVEGCAPASSFSTGYVTQFATNDEDPWIDIDCVQNIGSLDPNDKQGFPVGYGTEHYIRPGTELEYKIRFQNTGTDTAFTVRIVDTLSSWLDAATIRPGVSSHPYKFNFTGQGIAEFLYENILLPDSNVNQLMSQGFVKFSVYPRADAPLETLIENAAAIYFDFNEPVITNKTWHRLGEKFLMVVNAWQPQRPEYQVLVSPNPFGESTLLEVKGLASSQSIHLQVIDLQGNIVRDETASGPVLYLKKEGLQTGMYLFKLDQKGVLIGSGKLVVRD